MSHDDTASKSSCPVVVQRLASRSAHRLLEPDQSAAINDALQHELVLPTNVIDLSCTTRIFTAERRKPRPALRLRRRDWSARRGKVMPQDLDKLSPTTTWAAFVASVSWLARLATIRPSRTTARTSSRYTISCTVLTGPSR